MARTLILRDVPKYDSSWVIADVVKNPKRPGTDCWDRFAIFENGMSVEDFRKKCGKSYRLEISWCAARGYITLLNPADFPIPTEETETEEETEAAE